MFRKLLKNKKAQNTAEFALLISLVIAGVIAMQTYAQRALQGRIRDAAAYLTNQTRNLGDTIQYSPYYLRTDYNVTHDDVAHKVQNTRTVGQDDLSNRVREKDGFQEESYNTILIKGLHFGL